MSKTVVQRAFRYRFYPTEGQAAELSRTFGCVRLVYNKALEARTVAWRQEQRRIGYAASSALLTAWKRAEDLAFLNEVLDRDVNAVRNILAAGRAVAACGAGVRPSRR
ncbi:MAG TPA: helix-turn-helix domain-containing protein [Pseudonocardiaceae bacterium]